MKDLQSLYFEEYDDQDGNDFDYVGVVGKDPIKITNLTEQVNEFRRLYGRNTVIRVYKEEGVLCT